MTLLPVNTRWPWVTPAQFRPELVPEELMAQGLTVSASSSNPFTILMQKRLQLAVNRRRICTRSGNIGQRFSIYHL